MWKGFHSGIAVPIWALTRDSGWSSISNLGVTQGVNGRTLLSSWKPEAVFMLKSHLPSETGKMLHADVAVLIWEPTMD